MHSTRKFHFTRKKIEALPPNDRESKSTDQEYSDTTLGLKLFVSKNGRKSFHFRYCLNKKKRVIKIADFDCLSLQEVRDIASKYRGMVNRNVDPLNERDISREIPTLRAFAKTYIEWASFHKRSWKDDDNKLKADILPAFGERRLNEITGKDIQLYLEKIKTRTSGSCSNRHRSLWSKIFSTALLWSVIEGENPCSRIPKFPESSGRLRYLDHAEIKRFLFVLDAYQGSVSALLLKFLLFTGLRLGETKRLKWDDFGADGAVHIRMENAKSKKSRYVQLNSMALTVLADLEQLRAENNPYIFPGGRPGRHIINPKKLFDTVKTKAALEDVCIHTLRHTFATLSIAAGTDLYVVQSQLGHANYKTTQRYAHISPERIKTATENVAKEIGLALGDEL
ncbi:tyrosine-type recombinase/integrase [Desulfocastanea catecholica]